MYYAGIGSRRTPENILHLMTKIAKRLESRGFILRSGHANGADLAFERGVSDDAHKDIYLPWALFNDSDSTLYELGPEAIKSVRRYHPSPDSLSSNSFKLLARDWYQVMGKESEPRSAFIICWTPEGRITGGTGQALRIATDKKIKIFNLAVSKEEAIFRFLDVEDLLLS